MQGLLIFLSIFLFSVSIFSQEEASDTTSGIEDSIKTISKKFENFEYGDVINRTNKLLSQKNILSEKQIINLYRIKGISHFSLAEDQAAENSFVEILRIDSTFSFDSTKTSPKILSFFNQVKQRYFNKLLETSRQTVVRVDTVYIPSKDSTEMTTAEINQSVLFSLFVPGLGHVYRGNGLKGWILTTLSTASLGTMIYFIIDSYKKEQDYLNAANPVIIEDAYKKFNKSYKYRNISVAAYAVIWLYSQLDLILFSGKIKSEISDKFQMKYNPIRGTTVEFKFSF